MIQHSAHQTAARRTIKLNQIALQVSTRDCQDLLKSRIGFLQKVIRLLLQEVLKVSFNWRHLLYPALRLHLLGWLLVISLRHLLL